MEFFYVFGAIGILAIVLPRIESRIDKVYLGYSYTPSHGMTDIIGIIFILLEIIGDIVINT